MALHKDFPKNKFEILDPAIRCFPTEEDLRKDGYEKLVMLDKKIGTNISPRILKN